MVSAVSAIMRVLIVFCKMSSLYYAWRTGILAFLGDFLDFVGEPRHARRGRSTSHAFARDSRLLPLALLLPLARFRTRGSNQRLFASEDYNLGRVACT